MALASPTMSPPAKRRRLAAPANGGGILPTDELEEVLLRLPSKPLARLRAVCRSWRSLISAPHFVAEHARRRREDALLVAAVHHDAVRFDVRVLDMASGAVVAQLDGRSNKHHFGVAGGQLICCLVAGDDAGDKVDVIRVLHPPTGAMTSVHTATTAGGAQTTSSSSYVFGQVPATGELKILRIHTSCDDKRNQSCEILTLAAGEQSWRPASSPPMPVSTMGPRHRAIVQGVVYFMTSNIADHRGIATFDLATEVWRPTLLQGPISKDSIRCLYSILSLVDLNGCLAFVHLDYHYRSSSIDIWALADLDKGAWVKIQSLRLRHVLNKHYGEFMSLPLTVLDDGRIVLWVEGLSSKVRVYDPRTRCCKEIANMGKSCSIVGVYTGSLLGFMK